MTDLRDQRWQHGDQCFPREMMVSSTSCEKCSRLGHTLKESQQDLLMD